MRRRLIRIDGRRLRPLLQRLLMALLSSLHRVLMADLRLIQLLRVVKMIHHQFMLTLKPGRERFLGILVTL